MHRAKDILFASNEPDVERISRNAAASACYHGQSSQAGLTLVMSPQGRQNDVSQHQIRDCNGCESDEPSSSAREKLYQIDPAGLAFEVTIAADIVKSFQCQ
jgi:hypothetical protein